MTTQLTPSGSANRVCLKCGKHFLSAGPGNRICKPCTCLNAKHGFIPEAVLAKQRGVKRHNGLLLEETAEGVVS